MNKTVVNERSYNYLIQVKSSFFFKGIGVACSFLLIPLMINNLGQEKFGVWSTLFSILSWMTFFDLGLGNGLRNKLAESIAKGYENDARSYISSAYGFVGLISFLLFFIMACLAFNVPWQEVFNTSIVDTNELSLTVLVTSFFIALNFWLGLINSILNSLQKTSMVIFGQFLFNFISLIFVYSLTKYTNLSLVFLAIIYGVSMTLANVFVSVWFYRNNTNLIPKFSTEVNHLSPLLALGMQFFIIQIAVLLIFTTDKILISQLLGPQYVTSYEVVFKIFSVITLFHGLISGPLWSSYTDAYHRSDFLWMKVALKNQLKMFCLILFAVITLILIAKPVISFWIKQEIMIPTDLVVSMGIFILITTWNNIYAYLLNGIGEIKLQLCLAIFALLINVPLAIFFTKFLGWGLSGILLATCVSLSLFAVLAPIQVLNFFRSRL